MPRRAALAFALAFAVAFALAFASASPAGAQPRRYAEDPTLGLNLPAASLAGDVDATSTVLNPGGLPFLDGTHLELAVNLGAADEIAGVGTGVGLYWATSIALPLLPRIAFGTSIEKLTPPRVAVAPDPGEPYRLSFGTAWSLSPALAAGFTWHHFLDEEDGVLDGVDTFDVGIHARAGAHFALGAVVRDVLGPAVAGVPVQRRYDAEVIARPTGTDRLELALGAELGERRLDVDPRFRFSVRVADGAWVRGEVEARTLWRLDEPAFGAGDTTREWDVRGTLGIELSFGGTGIATYATAAAGDGSDAGFYGGATVIRVSSERLPSVIPRPDRIERVRIEGAMDQRTLTRLILKLRRLERDDDVKAVFLVIDDVELGFGDLQDVRDALFRLRERGKKVFAYLMAGGTRDYYVAAAANRIYLDAAGGLRLQGISSTVLYFKVLFDMLGVEAQFEKIEEWKSAPEAFTRSESSEEAAEMRDWLFDGVWAQITTDLARDRKRRPDEIQKLFDAGPYTAAEAGAAKLVDAVVEPAEVDALIVKEMERAYPVSDGTPIDRADAWERPQLAIVYLDGDIVDGKSQSIPILGRRLSGGDTISQAIAWARANPRVKAIVLRVDSPGGSATASEVISREVFKTRGVKPIVVSMGDIAASGGYFAAAGSDLIFAQPSTFTGSIGIFTGKFDLSTLLFRVGLTWETTNRGARADMESYFRPYTDDERKLIKMKLRYYYDRFRAAVAKGRGISVEDVDAVGRGQVFTGVQAKERKLVDRMGGLADAIAEAKSRAGYDEDDPLEVVMLPLESQSLLGQLLKLAGGDSGGDAATPSPFDEIFRAIPGSLLVGPDRPQARMPFELVFP